MERQSITPASVLQAPWGAAVLFFTFFFCFLLVFVFFLASSFSSRVVTFLLTRETRLFWAALFFRGGDASLYSFLRLFSISFLICWVCLPDSQSALTAHDVSPKPANHPFFFFPPPMRLPKQEPPRAISFSDEVCDFGRAFFWTCFGTFLF